MHSTATVIYTLQCTHCCYHSITHNAVAMYLYATPRCLCFRMKVMFLHIELQSVMRTAKCNEQERITEAMSSVQGQFYEGLFCQ